MRRRGTKTGERLLFFARRVLAPALMFQMPHWGDIFIAEDSVVRQGCRDLGMVQSAFRNMHFRGSRNCLIICNCCSCSRSPIIGYRVFKDDGFRYLPSKYVPRVDPGRCRECATYVEACPFAERILVKGSVEVRDCMGCEVCVRFCPEGANSMVPRREAVYAAGLTGGLNG